MLGGERENLYSWWGIGLYDRIWPSSSTKPDSSEAVRQVQKRQTDTYMYTQGR